MKLEGKGNPTIKESFGFREGADVEVFLVDRQSDRADRLGYLRPEHGNTPRLHERFQLELPAPENLSVFFGQTESKPHVIKLAKDSSGNLAGKLATDLFEAEAVLASVSSYNPGNYVLSVIVEHNEAGRRGSASNVLPSGWSEQPDA